jgi:hypothetical protein
MSSGLRRDSVCGKLPTERRGVNHREPIGFSGLELQGR